MKNLFFILIISLSFDYLTSKLDEDDYFGLDTKNDFKSLVDAYIFGLNEIKVYEIDEIYSEDNNYLYKTVEAIDNETNYYFSYMPSEILDVPIGAFSLEVDEDTKGSITDVICAFVENGSDTASMIEAIESVSENGNSYCIGSQNKINSKRYNYIFKYENKDKNIPKRLIIKVSNENENPVNSSFSIYMKKDQGVTIEHTDFLTLKEYGKDEELKKTVIPYIVDVKTLRGDSETDYVSKILFYSQHFEMQLYYIPEDSNAPIKLYYGNIALIDTKPDLALQKYNATTLVLISENLEGQEHSSLTNSFRFHTKMFKSEDQVDFFISQNLDGRSLNSPLSLEKNIFTSDNNKLYYILNYNKPEPTRTLHLDVIFGDFSQARIATEINAEKWDSLIENNMINIENYQVELPQKSQHIDIIEIVCKSPILLNIYYTNDEYEYNNVKEGEIVVKKIPAQNSFSFTIENETFSDFFFTMSLFNPFEKPNVTVSFSKGNEYYFSENSMKTDKLDYIPDKVIVNNNGNSQTRFIFKIGFGVESIKDWKEIQLENPINGSLFLNNNKYVYKFPHEDNKKNFTKVNFKITSLYQNDNVKFCFSTNLGIAIEGSKENCFKIDNNLYYNLTFTNPLIVAKNYKIDTDNYYIYLKPNEYKQLYIQILEEKYEATIRSDLGIHKLLTLEDGKAKTILSLPNEENSEIFVQLNICNEANTPIRFINYNAYTKEELYSEEFNYPDKNSILYTTTNTLLENEIQLIGEAGIRAFLKHTEIVDYSPNIVDYKTNADPNLLDEKYKGQLDAYIKAFKAMTKEDADAFIYHIDV